MSLFISSAARTDRGRRAENQDFVGVDDGLGLYLVADGTGGRAGGDRAARLAHDVIFREIGAQRQIVQSGDTGAISALIVQSIVRANEAIIAAQADPNLHGMATTVAVVLYDGRAAHIGYVGDSRVYRVKNGQLERLTRDHSLENFLADNPQVQPKVKRPGKTLLRALGMKPEAPKVDTSAVAVHDGDVLMLCSDGVTDALADWLIAEILSGTRATSSGDAAAALVRAAHTHGTMDNISALVLDVKRDVKHSTMIIDQASKPAALGWLTFLEGPNEGNVIALGATTRIGADRKNCEIELADGFASAMHAELYASEAGFELRDMGSTNGTFVNNVRVQHQVLVDGDVLRVGGTSMVYKSYRHQG